MDRTLVQTHSVKLTTLDSGDFPAHEGGSVLEILRAVFRPFYKLFVMGSQSLEVPTMLRR
jgi:hypothetical protein